ncbi:MAG TPA: hypothetical protein VKH82_16640 [Candidatus Binatia bacterium]|nr:hypothetical protein [Candidatus Binatia bacterium]
MIARSLAALLAAAVLIALVVPAGAKDEVREECKKNCEITLRSCRQDCQLERASGTDQESYLYKQCDQGCHDAYAGCVGACEPH